MAPGLIDSALGISSQFEFRSFSVSSRIPENLLILEEHLWEKSEISKCSSVKRELNHFLARELERKSGKTPELENPDISILFDFTNGEASVFSNPLYIFGRYVKHSRNLAQSKWHCKKCMGRGCDECGGEGRKYLSLEDLIAKPAVEMSKAKATKFHSSGREDVDVLMKGDGRPFIMELLSPKVRGIDLSLLENEVRKTGLAEIGGLNFTKKEMVTVLSDSNFDKEYEAVIELPRPATPEDIEKINKLAPLPLSQRTPHRVSHRRADRVRKRMIKSMSANLNDGLIELKMKTEAGTYIKEFITGDEGRTKPSISELLECDAKCLQLDVAKIYDAFIRELV